MLPSTPTTTAKPNSSTVCLFSRPTPARTPNASHSLALPVRMMRISTKAHPIQISGSTEFMER